MRKQSVKSFNVSCKKQERERGREEERESERERVLFNVFFRSISCCKIIFSQSFVPAFYIISFNYACWACFLEFAKAKCFISSFHVCFNLKSVMFHFIIPTISFASFCIGILTFQIRFWFNILSHQVRWSSFVFSKIKCSISSV